MKSFSHPAVTDPDSVLCDIIRAQQQTPFNRIVRFRDVAARVFPPKGNAESAIGLRYSMRRLRHFIASDPELIGRMRTVGYNPANHILTPRQVRVLGEYI